jgi:spoIIIJ-associated protein
MDTIETEADTIEQAIEKALKMLGVEREQITVEVLSEGKKGILGFGAQKARIRAALRKSTFHVAAPEAAEHEAEIQSPVSEAEASALTDKARTALSDILRLMGVQATVQTKPGSAPEEVVLDIRAENSGLLIGRKGQTLEALQYLITRIASERAGGEAPHIVVDVENYRDRRRKSLEDMALRLGEKAKRQRKTVTVDALSAADRRIIHAALQDDPWVTTRSLGQGSYRRLLIIPEGDRKKKEEAAAAPADKQTLKTSTK